jgi:sodium pump decarboxylase gamma subunit
MHTFLQGVTVSLIGQTVLFLFLGLLAGGIHLMLRLALRWQPAAPPHSPSLDAMPAAPAAPAAPDAETAAVITAAVTRFREENR